MFQLVFKHDHKDEKQLDQSGVIFQQVKQQWSLDNESPSGRLLGVELNYPIDSKVSSTLTLVPKRGNNVTSMIVVRGVQGGVMNTFNDPPDRGFGVAPPKLKIDKKYSL